LHKEKVKVAKAYLDKHHLELRLAEAMQAVLKDRPADPGSFIAERLVKNAHMITHLPKQQDKELELPPEVPKAPEVKQIVEETPQKAQNALQAPLEMPCNARSAGTCLLPLPLTPHTLGMHQMASVGSWLQPLPLKGRASVPETLTACRHTASVGSWLMPLPVHKSAIAVKSSTGVQMEKCTSECQDRKRLHIVPFSGLYGPLVWSCGVRPALSFLR